MNNELRAQIRSRMALKETAELLEIWQANDRFEWSDDTFEVIREILKERGLESPEQNEPVYEHKKEETELAEEELDEEEARIIEDENPPAFYDPLEVLLITKRLDWLAKVMLWFAILYNIINVQKILPSVQPDVYAGENLSLALTYLLAILALALDVAISIVVVYFPLKALAHILRILMEMEFKSRKGAQPSPPLSTS